LVQVPAQALVRVLEQEQEQEQAWDWAPETAQAPQQDQTPAKKEEPVPDSTLEAAPQDPARPRWPKVTRWWLAPWCSHLRPNHHRPTTLQRR
jgi:hypothetical protein